MSISAPRIMPTSATSSGQATLTGPTRRSMGSAIIAKPILRLVGPVSVAWPELVADVGIILGALIDILDHQHDRRAGGDLAAGAVVLEHSRQDFNGIRLLALGSEARLA